VTWRVHTFTSSGEFIVTSGGGNVEYLIVGAGGSASASTQKEIVEVMCVNLNKKENAPLK